MDAIKGLKILGAAAGVVAGMASAAVEAIKIKKLAASGSEAAVTKKD